MPTISTVPRPAYVYDSSASTWYPIGGQAQAFLSVYEYSASAGQTSFSGSSLSSASLTYTTNALSVFLNGVLLAPGDDYTATSGSSVVLSSSAAASDYLIAQAITSFTVANTYTQAEVTALIAAGGGGAGYQDIFLLAGM